MIIINAWPKGINNKIINIDPMVIPKFFVFIMFYFYLLLFILFILFIIMISNRVAKIQLFRIIRNT